MDSFFGCGRNFMRQWYNYSFSDEDIIIPTKICNLEPKMIYMGTFNSIVIDKNNEIWVFGTNLHGERGLGHNKKRTIHTKVPKIKAKHISCGSVHIGIIDENNNVWTWGSNYLGQLGIRNCNYKNIPTMIPDIKAKMISCGNHHTGIIDENNKVYIWGSNRDGQTGTGYPGMEDFNYYMSPMIIGVRAKYISCGGAHTGIIDMENNVLMFGNNNKGQLGLGTENIKYNNNSIPRAIRNMKAKFISCGGDHTGIIDMDNNVWMFGWNENGQLGLGDNINRNIPVMIPNMKAKFISCGGAHTGIIDEYNNVLMCGYNGDGRLGLGDKIDRYFPTMIPNIKSDYICCGTVTTGIIGIKF